MHPDPSNAAGIDNDMTDGGALDIGCGNWDDKAAAIELRQYGE